MAVPVTHSILTPADSESCSQPWATALPNKRCVLCGAVLCGSICLFASLPNTCLFRLPYSVQVDEMFRGAPVDEKGQFNYYEFTKILKHGSKDKNAE